MRQIGRGGGGQEDTEGAGRRGGGRSERGCAEPKSTERTDAVDGVDGRRVRVVPLPAHAPLDGFPRAEVEQAALLLQEGHARLRRVLDPHRAVLVLDGEEAQDSIVLLVPDADKGWVRPRRGCGQGCGQEGRGVRGRPTMGSRAWGQAAHIGPVYSRPAMSSSRMSGVCPALSSSSFFSRIFSSKTASAVGLRHHSGWLS